jgi:acetoin utilization deacetylase AcuC-like enzyme
MNRTGVVMHQLYIEHDPGPYHPETPERLRAIYRLLEEEGLKEKLTLVEPRPATREELGWVHSASYIQRVAQSSGRSVALDPDTQTSPESYQAALLAAGGAITLCEAITKGDLNNGFALVRPPGHHAERDRSMGFCLFNNVAIAAEFARKKAGLGRVLIVDWDVHHGNGTMHSFYDRKDVLYFSTHQYPFYPGTGAIVETGRGEGEGHTVNVPFGQPMGDIEYKAVFRDVLAPIAEQFSPDIILASVGFDIYYQDPLGGMKVTEEGFGELTHQLMSMANVSCGGKLMLVLEGGYHVEGEARGVGSCLSALLGLTQSATDSGEQGGAAAIIQAAKKIQSKFWKF